jgi:hypothetical protein
MIAPSIQGTCHGFQVVSTLSHPTLTGGEGSLLRVEEIPVRHQAMGSQLLSFEERQGRLPMTIHAIAPGRFEVGTTSLGVFAVDVLEQRIGVPESADPIRREMLTLGTPMALLIQHNEDLALHAAALAPHDRAVLVTGEGGVGKSTLTAAALARGWRVLGDDLVRVRTDPTPVVFQGPAVARVREPTMALLDLSRVVELARAAGKIHLLPKPFPAYPSNAIEVAAVVIISSDLTGPQLEPVPPEAAIPQLWRQAFYLPNDSARASCFSMLTALVDSVPVMRLSYPHDPDLLQSTLDLLADPVQTNA